MLSGNNNFSDLYLITLNLFAIHNGLLSSLKPDGSYLDIVEIIGLCYCFTSK